MNEPKGEAMKKLSDGGPAFPDPAPREDGHLGMTLRDYFAAAAMQGMAAGSMVNDSQTFGTKTINQLKTPLYAHDIARWCYELADAMLSAKDRK